MRITVIRLFFIYGLFLIATPSEGQILKRLQQKAENALEKKVEEKIDREMEKAAERMVENSWDAVFGGGGEGGKAGAGMPFSLNSDVTTEDQYQFDIITTMEIENIKANGKSDPPMSMEMHFREGAQYTGTKFTSEEMKKNQGDMFIIYDFKNSAMIMLMGSEEGKFSFAYDWTEALEYAENMEENEEEVNWDEVNEWEGYTKIGSKNIAGYSCDGYITENEDTKTEIWVTREETFGMENMFGANANAKQMKGKIPENYPYGMFMEMTMENKGDGEKTIMRVTDVNENANVSYNMSDYPKMALGAKN
ncbi:DUF4412 domain-containing protein [Fulvivirgaceae bacterium LMO-SS25]